MSPSVCSSVRVRVHLIPRFMHVILTHVCNCCMRLTTSNTCSTAASLCVGENLADIIPRHLHSHLAPCSTAFVVRRTKQHIICIAIKNEHGGEGSTHGLACRFHETMDVVFCESRDREYRVFARPCSQSTTAKRCDGFSEYQQYRTHDHLGRWRPTETHRAVECCTVQRSVVFLVFTIAATDRDESNMNMTAKITTLHTTRDNCEKIGQHGN